MQDGREGTFSQGWLGVCCGGDHQSGREEGSLTSVLIREQKGQNQSPSGMASRGDSRQKVWKPASHLSHKSMNSS